MPLLSLDQNLVRYHLWCTNHSCKQHRIQSGSLRINRCGHSRLFQHPRSRSAENELLSAHWAHSSSSLPTEGCVARVLSLSHSNWTANQLPRSRSIQSQWWEASRRSIQREVHDNQSAANVGNGAQGPVEPWAPLPSWNQQGRKHCQLKCTAKQRANVSFLHRSGDPCRICQVNSVQQKGNQTCTAAKETRIGGNSHNATETSLETEIAVGRIACQVPLRQLSWMPEHKR